MIRILIVDDQETMRLGLTLQLKRQESVTVVGAASDGLEAISVIEKLVDAGTPPDVVLMDIRMPKLNGIEATGRITARWPQVRVLALTTFDQDEYAFGILRAGASGFLLKDASTQELLAGIRAVAAGDAVLSPRVTTEVIRRTDLVSAHRAASREEAVRTVARLTSRERELLKAIGRGLTNPEIAEEMVVSPASVKTFVARLLAKCNARDRVGLVILAHDSEILDRPGG